MKFRFPFFGKSQNIVCTTKQVYDEKSDATLDKVLGNDSGGGESKALTTINGIDAKDIVKGERR